MALLHARGVTVIPYVDNLLMKALSRDDLFSLSITLDTLERFSRDCQTWKVIPCTIPIDGITGDNLQYQDCQDPPSTGQD